MEFVERGLNFLGLLLVLGVVIGIVAVIVLFVIDRFQTRDAILRNYPVLGRSRGLFTTLGEFFRQYFFAMDREEMPFNRAQRGWVEHAAKGDSNTVAFGSTRNIDIVGTAIFVNSAFPPLDEDAAAAAPMMDLVGMPIRDALPRTVDMLHEYGLRNRIRLISSAKLVNPGDVAWALASGADFVTSARGFMFALGCIQALKCNKNTCPTGITTHDPQLQKGLVVEDKYRRVANYATAIVKDVEMIAHSVGVDDPRKLSRAHVRVVQPNGRSIRMNELFPEPERITG